TRSAAKAGSLSECPSAQRYSTAMFCPSTNPVSRNPLRQPATKSGTVLGDLLSRNPTVGCCARAASGQVTAAPPRSAINSRRLMSDIGASSGSAYRTLNLPQKGWQVLGADLNCSEI